MTTRQLAPKAWAGWLAGTALAALTACNAQTSAPAQVVDAPQASPAKKRAAPPVLPSLEHQGVRYAELRGGRARGLTQNGGLIVATDVASGTELWVQTVFGLAGSPDLETDKRDVYITRLSISADGRELLIENERQQRFALRLSDRSVQPLPR